MVGALPLKAHNTRTLRLSDDVVNTLARRTTTTVWIMAVLTSRTGVIWNLNSTTLPASSYRLVCIDGATHQFRSTGSKLFSRTRTSIKALDVHHIKPRTTAPQNKNARAATMSASFSNET